MDNNEFMYSPSLMQFSIDKQFYTLLHSGNGGCYQNKENPNILNAVDGEFVMIYPDTLGCYVQRNTTSGEPIFSGDIVEITWCPNKSPSLMSIVETGKFLVEFGVKGLVLCSINNGEQTFTDEEWDALDNCKIIGNICDNPGLLLPDFVKEVLTQHGI